MRYEDAITISTPEGVELELPLAGLGSRFVAALVDIIIKAGLILALRIALGVAEAYGAALFSVLAFLVFFGYDILFETLASGRTPGKRWSGLRVVRLEGQPIGFVSSAIRNTLRLVDGLPFGYVIGAISILASSKNQRLGDIAAGALVIREPSAPRTNWTAPSFARRQAPVGWDVSSVTVEEVGAVRGFLERRYDLTPEARRQLGSTLAERLRPKVVGVPDDMDVETFLESLDAAKAARG
jgi:uncharacterized RDD family membrane protein YckC